MSTNESLDALDRYLGKPQRTSPPKDTPNMKKYVSIDLETTGLDPETCQILEIGAVIDDWKPGVEDLPTFHCYVDNGLIQGEPYGLSMHSKILRYIATGGKGAEEEVPILTPDSVAGWFLEWLHEHDINPDKRHITAAGKNFASFDRQFLKRLPDWTDFIKTQHRCIDPGNLYWDPRVDGQGLPSTETCKKRAGTPGEVAHTAVEDAFDVVRLIRAWFPVRTRWSE